MVDFCSNRGFVGQISGGFFYPKTSQIFGVKKSIAIWENLNTWGKKLQMLNILHQIESILQLSSLSIQTAPNFNNKV